ncbi:MAG: hypothetical protein KKA32_16690, partial [Actinobacteria bacterium]|nr:hypothetical protein [Actinomycetota bacterium]
GRLHLTGAFLSGTLWCVATHILPGKRALVSYLLPDCCGLDRWIRAKFSTPPNTHRVAVVITEDGRHYRERFGRTHSPFIPYSDADNRFFAVFEELGGPVRPAAFIGKRILGILSAHFDPACLSRQADMAIHRNDGTFKSWTENLE